TDVLRDEARREREERDAQKQADVRDEEAPVGPLDLTHDRVVVDPHDPDRDEARRIRGVGRPDVHEALAEVRRVAYDLRVDVQDQQRGGDREYAVREGLEPRGAHERSVASVSSVTEGT